MFKIVGNKKESPKIQNSLTLNYLYKNIIYFDTSDFQKKAFPNFNIEMICSKN